MALSHGFARDFIVIGGGSGGMAAAKEAARLGAKVTMFDFVHPTVHGTKWGLGGTCVNVGCIPKKLMHRSARIGHSLSHDVEQYGWDLQGVKPALQWERLVETVQNYVKSLNFSYKNGCRVAKVEYVNAPAAFKDKNTVVFKNKGETQELSAKYILIAVGGRPLVPTANEVPGARELAITSDDLFSLKSRPGKTLVVGASYIALECAGFLTDFGFDTTVAVRSILLRGFDRQCSEKIGKLMTEMGTKLLMGAVPSKLEKTDDGKIKVWFVNQPNEPQVYDTVLYATGRAANTAVLGLENLSSDILSLPSGKIVTNERDETVIPGIFALGDCAKGRPELTPVAVRAGELLSRRLFGNAQDLMDYHNIPTTVFTPVEYGCCGLSEDDAIAKYGADKIETYLFEFSPIEVSAAHWAKVEATRENEYDTDMQPTNLSKVVCLTREDKQEQVVGYHCIGLNAGEITQGYALAIKAGLTKAHLNHVVGIHPTDAESFTDLTITRRSGESWVATGGCGGGRCG